MDELKERFERLKVETESAVRRAGLNVIKKEVETLIKWALSDKETIQTPFGGKAFLFTGTKMNFYSIGFTLIDIETRKPVMIDNNYPFDLFLGDLIKRRTVLRDIKNEESFNKLFNKGVKVK